MERICKEDSLLDLQAYILSLELVRRNLVKLSSANASKLYNIYTQRIGRSSWYRCVIYCAIYGRTRTFKYLINLPTSLLISNASRLQELDEDGLSPLHHACICDRHSIIAALLEKKVDVILKVGKSRRSFFSSASSHPKEIFNIVKEGDTAFDICIKLGNIHGLRALLKFYTLYLNTKDKAEAFLNNHANSLYYAARQGFTRILHRFMSLVFKLEKDFKLLEKSNGFRSIIKEESLRSDRSELRVSNSTPKLLILNKRKEIQKVTTKFKRNDINTLLYQGYFADIRACLEQFGKKYYIKELEYYGKVAVLLKDSETLSVLLKLLLDRTKTNRRRMKKILTDFEILAIKYSSSRAIHSMLIKRHFVIDNKPGLFVELMSTIAYYKNIEALDITLRLKQCSIIDYFEILKVCCKVGNSLGVTEILSYITKSKQRVYPNMIKSLLNSSLLQGYDNIARRILESTKDQVNQTELINNLFIGTYPVLNFSLRHGMTRFVEYCKDNLDVNFNQINLCDKQSCLMGAANFRSLFALLTIKDNRILNLNFNNIDNNGSSFLKYLLQRSILQGENINIFVENKLYYFSPDEICRILKLLVPYQEHVDFNIQCNIRAQYFYPQWFVTSNQKVMQTFFYTFGNKIDLNQTDSLGLTYFYRCVQLGWYNNVLFFQKLAETYDVDLNAADREGWNPFLYYCRYNRVNYLRRLLSYKYKIPIDVNAKTRNGYSGVIIAAAYGHISVLKLLLEELKLDIDLTYKFNNKTAKQVARDNNYLECAAFLDQFSYHGSKRNPNQHRFLKQDMEKAIEQGKTQQLVTLKEPILLEKVLNL